MWPWLVSLLASKAAPAAKSLGWMVLKGLVYALVLLGLVWCIYITMIRPHTKPNPTTTVESGGINNTYNIKVGLGGCSHIVPTKR